AARWRNLALRLLLIYFIVGMAIVSFVNHPKNPRFIVTFVPAAHVLTGATLGWLLDRQRASSSWTRGVVATGITTVIVCTTLSVPVLLDRYAAYPSLMEVEYETSPQIMDLAAWLDSQIPAGERFYLVNYWDHFSPQALAWHRGTAQTVADIDFADVDMPATLLETASPQTITQWQQEIEQSGVRYLVTLEGGPWGAPPWPAYTTALADSFAPIVQETFAIEQYDAEQWLDRSLLRQAEWEQVKCSSRYTLNIKAVVYRRNDNG
ncbi:MAG TPA: hypothetical protein VF177_21065, partial [Anaerolineae bacterium]